MEQEKFIGSWKLIRCELTSPSGEVSDPYGKGAMGRITYEAGGRVAVQIMQPDRPAGDGTILNRGTPEEMIAAYRGYIAYFGSYSVDAARGVVIHKIEGSLIPGMVGGKQERPYCFSGDRLALIAETEQGRGKLVWERLQ